MNTELKERVEYVLHLEDDFLILNQCIGKKIFIKMRGYQCLGCGIDEKIFREGHCKSCFFTIPQLADWIIHPELSKAHLGIQDRDLSYEKDVQLQPHIVYLAASSGVKVGVTTKRQIPDRWIDQGASRALEILEVPNRYLAGITEVALKKHISDKTAWKKMLTNEVSKESLLIIKESLLKYVPKEARPYILDCDKEKIFNYPVFEYPKKVKRVALDKSDQIEGVLTGIKGQYLIFRDGNVFNVRSHQGYKVWIEL